MDFKKSNVKTFFLYLFLIAGLFIMFSCQKAGDPITIRVAEDTNYPVINISKPGEDLTISPISKNKGSIGFQKDGETTWLKGEPEIARQGARSAKYKWKLNSGKIVTMEVNPEKTDLQIHLMLNSITEGIQPRKWFVNIKAENNEYYTGVLERVVDGPQHLSWEPGIETAMNLRGEEIGVKLKPTVSAYAPFYLSSKNYGLFVNGTWPGKIDFCKSNQNFVQVCFQGPDLSLKIYRDENPAGIVKRHAKETGPSIVPPKWSFGPWRWLDEHKNRNQYFDGTDVKAPYNSDLVKDILMMEAYDIACTAYWVDRPWGAGKRGFDDYEFSKSRFPNAEDMIDWIKDKDMEMMIWIAPFVMGDMANVAEERGYYLKSNRWKDSRQVLVDFTNPEAVEWWKENGPAKLARMGIKGFKLDRADGEKLLDSLNMYTHDSTTYRENFNDYPVQYVKAANEAVSSVLGNDFILFPRAKYTGSAKYGGMWAGDTRSHAEGLRSAIIAMQRCAVMGYPNWGSDVGGYAGDFDREVTKRWLGFGCFSPLMEVGPTEDRGFWNMETEPHHDPEMIATWRLYSKVRMKLMDYVREASQKASKTGMPIARPLFLEYPDQQEAWQDWQTYKLGSDLLISAIWQKGKATHELYLPAGETWVDAWNIDQEYTGGKYIEVDSPPHKTPVFIRKGSSLKLGDLEKIYEKSLELAQKKFSLNELEAKEGWR